MDRRALLGVLGTSVVSAGCLSDQIGKANTGTVLEHFESEPARPECDTESETIKIEYEDDETHEYETAETMPYPAPLEAFTEDSGVKFVRALEKAYVRHDILCDRRGSAHVIDIHYRVRRTEIFDWYDDITVVFLSRAGAVSAMLHGDGSMSVSAPDYAYEGVVYAVDPTGAARIDFGDANTDGSDGRDANVPDPLTDGTLVAVSN